MQSVMFKVMFQNGPPGSTVRLGRMIDYLMIDKLMAGAARCGR